MAEKRGETVLNFVLVIGLLIVALVAFSSLQSIFFWQGGENTKDAELEFFNKAKQSIEQPMLFPSDSINEIIYSETENFEVSVNRNTLTINFPTSKNTFSSPLFISAYNIIPSNFSQTGKITIISRNQNLFVTDKPKCVFYDDICDPGCMMNPDKNKRCDPDCYNETKSDSCISYCVDKNQDGNTNNLDADGVCDPDCYNNYKKGEVYDFDCLVSGDSICDPGTHLIKDGYCDLDCVGNPPDFNGEIPNGVCDPDCSRFDIDCPHFGNKRCELNFRENCKNTDDCKCGANTFCRFDCPSLTKKKLLDDMGCADKSYLLARNGECKYQCECDEGLVCTDSHCCPPNEYWDTELNTCITYALNGKCDPDHGENCNNNIDCMNECTATGTVCCIVRSTAGTNGCVAKLNSPEGTACMCEGDCASTLHCISDENNLNNRACCPDGTKWDSNEKACKKDTPNLGTCSYCGINKALFKKYYPEEYDEKCSNSDVCCQGNCPPGTVLNAAPYYEQCTLNYNKNGVTNCGWGCGPTSVKMAIDSITGKNVDVGKIWAYYQPSAYDTLTGADLANAVKGLSTADAVDTQGAFFGTPSRELSLDINKLDAHIRSGNFVAQLTIMSFYNDEAAQRTYPGYHYFLIVGISDSELIINDPCPTDFQNKNLYKYGQNMVLRKSTYNNKIRKDAVRYQVIITK